MNPVYIIILMCAAVILFVLSSRYQSHLRNLLLKHGKNPRPLLFPWSIVNHINLARDLLVELTDQAEAQELKHALARADRSHFLTIVIVFGLGLLFLIIGM